MRILSAGLPACLLAVVLGACESPSAKVTQLQFGTSNTLATTGNLRLVTERPRPGPDGSLLPIVCTEPSPDYAIAFGQKGGGNLKLTLPQGSGEGAFTAETTETATELKGRTAGVLALRDGLYAACQAYANGVIGHDAYAMILSQYGTLLVALVGSEKVEAAPGRTDPARRAALSALLVSCISEFDRTRLATAPNALLDPGFCKAVLRRSLSYGAGPV
jgi:hypothetical protein